MRSEARAALLLGALLGLGEAPLWASPKGGPAAADPAKVKRGEAVFRASGGCSCHVDPKSDDKAYAGGRPQGTPFGVFYSTNITSDPDHGLGRWSEDDFVRAMTRGEGPHGKNYFPVFPYTSFSKMRPEDLSDLWAYVATLPPSPRADKAPDAPWPFSWRPAVTGWKWLFLDPPRPFVGSRGAYLVHAVAHCGECHTPRNLMGAMVQTDFLKGNPDGPEGKKIPGLRPSSKGVGSWDESDIVTYLKTGMTPDGDFAAGLMAEVIDEGYKHLPDEDLQAIAAYLKSLPPQ